MAMVANQWSVVMNQSRLCIEVVVRQAKSQIKGIINQLGISLCPQMALVTILVVH